MSFDKGGNCKQLERGMRRDTARSQQIGETPDHNAERYALLLREGDHRIKNSLQIVSSLLSLQASREENPHAREALRSAAGRIQSVARMHDALQAGEGEDWVNLGTVLETMCGSLRAMGGDTLGVDIQVETQSCRAPVAIARSLGLAVNELVVNALRHAFPDGRAGSILIRLTCDHGQLCLLVADDGVGLPADRAEGRGYGMKLVRMMVGQINGVLHVSNNGGAGTKIEVVLPRPQIVAE
jgi:two-component sensor histidine kinase